MATMPCDWKAHVDSSPVEIPDGIITVNSPSGKMMGFTSDRFDEQSYLWRDGDRIVISLLIVKEEGRGYLSGLIKEIKARGFSVAVPTPLGKMRQILLHKGFTPNIEEDPMFGSVEMWTHQNDNTRLDGNDQPGIANEQIT